MIDTEVFPANTNNVAVNIQEHSSLAVCVSFFKINNYEPNWYIFSKRLFPS